MSQGLEASMNELTRTALGVKAERDAFRRTLVKIMDTVYAKDQDEITRLNDIYDCARDAIASTQ